MGDIKLHPLYCKALEGDEPPYTCKTCGMKVHDEELLDEECIFCYKD